MLHRRAFLGALIAAPAVIRVAKMMPINSRLVPMPGIVVGHPFETDISFPGRIRLSLERYSMPSDPPPADYRMTGDYLITSIQRSGKWDEFTREQVDVVTRMPLCANLRPGDSVLIGSRAYCVRSMIADFDPVDLGRLENVYGPHSPEV